MYIMFLWPAEDEYVSGSLESQISGLMDYLDSFNRRGKFIVVACGYEKFSTFVKEIIYIIWKTNKITNVPVIIPNNHTFISESTLLSVDNNEPRPMVHVCTWSAYESGECGEVNVKQSRYTP
jgi:hypothetical protein